MAKDLTLLKIELEIAQAKTKIKELKSEMESLDMRYTENKEKASKLAYMEGVLARSKEKLAKYNKSLADSEKQVSKSRSELTKITHQSDKATGGATASVLELGRVVSDSNYGIRGMANNLSQLGTSMAFTFKSAGSLAAGFRALGSALLGPLGVIVAFNALLAVLERYEIQNQSAKKSTEEHNEELKKQDEILIELSNSYIKFNNNKQLNEFYTKALIRQSSKLRKILSDENLTQEQKNSKVEEFVRLKELEINNENRLIKVKALRKKLEEAESKVREKYRRDLIGVKGTKAELGLVKKMNDEIKKSSQDIKVELQQILREYVGTLNVIEGISQSLFPEKKKETKERETKTVDIADFDLDNFDVKSKDLLSKTSSLNQQIEMALAESEQEKLDIQLKYQQQSVFASKKAEIQKINDARKLYEKKINDEFSKEEAKNKKLLKSIKISQSQFDDWQIKASQEVIDKLDEADIKQAESIEGVIKKYDALFELYEKLYGARLKAIGADDGESKDKELEKIASWLNAYKDLVGGVTDFINGEFQRQLTIEQNKTNALNEELNNRLLNERLSKDERAKIQNEIWQNDENLRKKQNEIKKKQFNANKAFNMSTAVIDTYFAAQRAYASQMTLTPDAPIRAKIAAAVATAAGLARVASIARQKFQPEAATTPIRTASAGGGSGVGDRSFNFNLVGANQQNQLVQAIQGQFDRPLKAYVVSKDITNQQQLDANTRATARFGG